MKSFKVTWTMHVSALTPREAARSVWAQMGHIGYAARTNSLHFSAFPLLTVVSDDGHTTDIIPESQEGPETK
jgi:hypothetical protein